ncbi:TetR family transcriptional regulator [Streptomyces sp. ISL-87]|nr:TetR family transcriptional regulator [Streptomyces sp. ISL-21]MBT2455769.1 TetR family transcriptional regulator [Streptomyces sp. ISL-86]MBT2609518.1 TetR family transcriptional regulator [Streptomyces sp. ISL-87]
MAARLRTVRRGRLPARSAVHARVDRIAETAQANKRLIYVYYGNKEQLFDAVLQRALETGSESVPFSADDLPGYAGAVFDHLVERPALMRLVLWKQLERPDSTDTEAESYRAKIAVVEQAQRAGRIDAALDPADILTLVMGLSQAWFGAVGSPAAGDGGTGWPPERLARHRAAVVESVRRITAGPRDGS